MAAVYVTLSENSILAKRCIIVITLLAEKRGTGGVNQVMQIRTAPKERTYQFLS